MSGPSVAPQLSSHELMLYNYFLPCMAKVHLFDAAGNPCGQGSGFSYDLSERVLTSGHLLGYNNATHYVVEFHDGSRSPAVMLFQYLDPDVMCMTTQRRHVSGASSRTSSSRSSSSSICAGNPDELVGAAPTRAEAVFTLGFPGADQQECAYTSGNLRTTNVNNLTATAHASNGSSGGPCFNMNGLLLGMVQGPVGGVDPSVRLVSADTLDTALRMNNCPGLRS